MNKTHDHNNTILQSADCDICMPEKVKKLVSFG